MRPSHWSHYWCCDFDVSGACVGEVIVNGAYGSDVGRLNEIDVIVVRGKLITGIHLSRHDLVSVTFVGVEVSAHLVVDRVHDLLRCGTNH